MCYSWRQLAGVSPNIIHSPLPAETRAPKPNQTERGPGLPGGGATETLPPPAEGGGPTGRGHSPRLPLPLQCSVTTELEATVDDMTRPKTADSRLSSETGPTRLKPRGMAHLPAGTGAQLRTTHLEH